MNKTLEYMAFGKPQVMFATKEGRASAGEAAAYVEENSAEQLGNAISRLLDDEAARVRMGRSGEDRIRTQLSWDQSVPRLLEAYHAATGSHSTK
jgi:glycosyltransferase involved in cell wall biosynthesis